ncbi:uncharacterized protein [Macaca nemestrina]|uniref:uncharacterized protein n=1 Tax=Macaca nemestrina TaxID=9545 RepID=UPI0039B9B38B
MDGRAPLRFLPLSLSLPPSFPLKKKSSGWVRSLQVHPQPGKGRRRGPRARQPRRGSDEDRSPGTWRPSSPAVPAQSAESQPQQQQPPPPPPPPARASSSLHRLLLLRRRRRRRPQLLREGPPPLLTLLPLLLLPSSPRSPPECSSVIYITPPSRGLPGSRGPWRARAHTHTHTHTQTHTTTHTHTHTHEHTHSQIHTDARFLKETAHKGFPTTPAEGKRSPRERKAGEVKNKECSRYDSYLSEVEERIDKANFMDELERQEAGLQEVVCVNVSYCPHFEDDIFVFAFLQFGFPLVSPILLQ